MNVSPAPQTRAHRRKVLNITPTEFGTGVRAALERRGVLDVERAPIRYLFLFALNWDGDSARPAGAAELSQLALAS
jgi:hypothetical protein